MPISKQELLSLIKPDVLRWLEGRVSFGRTRRVSMQLVPQHGYTDAAGNVVWTVATAGGPSAVRFRSTGAGVTYRWLAAWCQVPQDWQAGTGGAVKVRLRAASGTVNIQNWQVYIANNSEGGGEVWNVAGPDTFGSTSIGTSWTTLTLKAVTTTTLTAAGQHIAVNFGVGANSVTWAADLIVAELWFEYTSTY